MKHKCRIWKLNPTAYDVPWVTECYSHNCRLYNDYLESATWEEAMVEALHHRLHSQ